jgi:hypothetical protein
MLVEVDDIAVVLEDEVGHGQHDALLVRAVDQENGGTGMEFFFFGSHSLRMYPLINSLFENILIFPEICKMKTAIKCVL